MVTERTELMDAYTAWARAELQWAEELRRQKKKTLRKVRFLILIPFLVGAVVVPFAMRTYVSELAEGLAYSLLLLTFGLLLILLVSLFLLPHSTKGFYAKRLRKSAARLAPTPSQQELLGQDLLEALKDPTRHFDFTDMTQQKAPLHFVLGRRYAYISGGWNYAPFLLPLAGIRGFAPGQSEAVVGGEAIRLYFIWFEGLPKKDGFCFHDAASRDRALAMLRKQLPERFSPVR